MDLRRLFKKLGRHKKPGSESHESPSRSATPLSEASIRTTSPRPVQSGAISASVLHSSTQMHVSPPLEHTQNEAPSPNNDAWMNLTAFLDLLNNTPAFTPLAAAIDSLSWFVRAHENVLTLQKEYVTLRTQLEGLFKDLCANFSGSAPPAMTTSILNLSEAIRTELVQVYGTQDHQGEGLRIG